jgi:hypothetical protein
MAKLRLAAIVEKVIIDARTRGASLISLIDGIQTTRLPLPAGGLFDIFTIWHRDEANEVIHARLIPQAPDGLDIPEAANTELLKGEQRTHRWIARLPLWSINAPGLWAIRIEHEIGEEWQEVGRLSLEIDVSSEAS